MMSYKIMNGCYVITNNNILLLLPMPPTVEMGHHLLPQPALRISRISLTILCVIGIISPGRTAAKTRGALVLIVTLVFADSVKLRDMMSNFVES